MGDWMKQTYKMYGKIENVIVRTTIRQSSLFDGRFVVGRKDKTMKNEKLKILKEKNRRMTESVHQTFYNGVKYKIYSCFWRYGRL